MGEGQRTTELPDWLSPDRLQQPIDWASGLAIAVDKPLRWTSFDVVNKVRYALKPLAGQGPRIKVGHAGTLDPLATGMLILACGRATRALDRFQGMEKTYTGTLRLGETSPSYDGETPAVAAGNPEGLDLQALQGAAQGMCGSVLQVPPAYSAIKTQGRRSYRDARKGQTVTLEARPVEVQEFGVLWLQGREAGFRVRCSKGTYVRSLVHDLGQQLGCGAWMSSLKRDAIGPYGLDTAWSLDELIRALSLAGSQTPPTP
jgi:tRNA pseudouridine55 synthase